MLWKSASKRRPNYDYPGTSHRDRQTREILWQGTGGTWHLHERRAGGDFWFPGAKWSGEDDDDTLHTRCYSSHGRNNPCTGNGCATRHAGITSTHRYLPGDV